MPWRTFASRHPFSGTLSTTSKLLSEAREDEAVLLLDRRARAPTLRAVTCPRRGLARRRKAEFVHLVPRYAPPRLLPGCCPRVTPVATGTPSAPPTTGGRSRPTDGRDSADPLTPDEPREETGGHYDAGGGSQQDAPLLPDQTRLESEPVSAVTLLPQGSATGNEKDGRREPDDTSSPAARGVTEFASRRASPVPRSHHRVDCEMRNTTAASSLGGAVVAGVSRRHCASGRRSP